MSRYREFTSADNMRRVVNLLHRQAVKAKAEGLFFEVRVVNLFMFTFRNALYVGVNLKSF